MRPIDILLVEDSPTDCLVATEALQQAKLLNNLHVAVDGIEALAFLRRQGKYRDAPRPDLILLDLNLPRKDGRELLAEIKQDEFLRLIPVVVLTSSQAPEDVVRAYGLHANCYVKKPVDFGSFTEVVKTIKNFWFHVVTLPPGGMLPRALPQTPRRPASKSGQVESKAFQLLLVEDNPADRLLFLDALNQVSTFHFELTEASRLAEAQTLLAEKRFDAVLTDLQLPDSSGLDTCRRILAESRGAPVIVLTAQNDEHSGLQALTAGAQDYLAKQDITGTSLGRSIRYAIERSVMGEQMRQTQKLQGLGQLAGGVAHEFNNLLTVIQGHLDMQRARTDLDPELTGALEAIAKSAERAADLTRQLLHFSRRRMMNPKVVDLNQAVAAMVKMLKHVVGEKIGVELRLASKPLAVEADVGMLEQAVLNLALNARDAMPAGGKLTLTTELLAVTEANHADHPEGPLGSFVRLTVADTGSGIVPQALPHLFEPFFTTKEVGQGTGLGLATVFGIVQQHRGWISVRSRAGAGASFHLNFPHFTGGVAAVQLPVNLSTKSGRGETILVVEDQIHLRQMVETVLTREGYRVLEASTGVEALQIVEREQANIALIFTDLVMPEGISGTQLAAVVRERHPAIKLLFTSGYSTDFLENPETFVEGENFLSKPYSVLQLGLAIKRALGVAI